MKFINQTYPPGDFETHKNLCVLSDDGWDDFGFKTAFKATLFDSQGTRYDLGSLKIMSKGMESGRVRIPRNSDGLGPTYCSLGGDRDYYLGLAEIDVPLRNSYLDGVRDCVKNLDIWAEFREEEAMGSSLLRWVSVRDVEVSFPRILAGSSELTSFSFKYLFRPYIGAEEEFCHFQVEPETLPPSNIHVLIGRNGVGKTRLIAGMADALTESKAATISLPGRFEFLDKESDAETDFLNLVVVAYSVFDRLNPINKGTNRTKRGVPYQYVGIKKFSDGEAEEDITLKSSDDMTSEFDDCLWSIIADASRLERWIKALKVLESDPGIKALNFPSLLEDPDDLMRNEIRQKFEELSSGHKIVLLTIARLVELVSDRTLVLIDEPETHLHPPLLGSFVRALSELLMARNGVAILATHSPVVLQEVPSSCVSVLRSSGSSMRIDRPEIETFAENVGMLTRKVFGLEVEESGYFNLIRKNADGRVFEDLLDQFDNNIGTEGRALARALTAKGEGQ
ncbi:AAA family ATPase [Thalassovita sp.]|uniref:AAA family ATPase n=1 Tax=Thalassovita sp. TaxID=1979401 RepID=UPI002B27A415|nr:AAA family ATPase [Thalassovita sp.]